ncbi:hypothetical protein GCM10023194_02270 [Planotetraspora phitsanulokensis]|uniref:Uncharacterized protein n=1 Tax=Planotetraspora phitsanulokensis TaxID=575192 RepID=A0A8J3UBC7_9ACTN|nr:hypothetical protein [Planotetraspora phitsanulokensis]GII40497.1 hypothetical protein Pph01_55000 [Planotetraspora phitsanulokensis]
MPSFDSARDRFRLGPAHLGVLGCLYEGKSVTSDLVAARDELRAAGLVSDDDAVLPELAGLTAALAEPIVLIVIEITGAHGLTNHGAVIGNDAVYTYETWPGETESEYVRTDLSTLVWSLARIVGLRDKEAKPPAAPVVTTKIGVMDAGFTALSELESDDVVEAADRLRALFSESGLADPELTVLTHLLLQLNGNWRMTVAWNNREGKGTDIRGIAVLDCGPLGYWVRELPAEPIGPGTVTPDSDLRLVYTDVRQVWELITDLLPDAGDLPVPVER